MKLYGSRNFAFASLCLGTGRAGATYDYDAGLDDEAGEGRGWFQSIRRARFRCWRTATDATESAAIVHYIAEKFRQSGSASMICVAAPEAYQAGRSLCADRAGCILAIAQHRFALPEDKRVAALEPTAIWQSAGRGKGDRALATSPYIAGEAFTRQTTRCSYCLWAFVSPAGTGWRLASPTSIA